MRPTVYLDSCLVIYLVEGSPERTAATQHALQAYPAVFCISDLVRLECLVGPIKSQNDEVLQNYQLLFESFACLPISDNTYDMAAEIRANHGLLLPDALHLAIAVTNGCDEFWTADTHFDRMVDQLSISIKRVG